MVMGENAENSGVLTGDEWRSTVCVVFTVDEARKFAERATCPASVRPAATNRRDLIPGGVAAESA